MDETVRFWQDESILLYISSNLVNLFRNMFKTIFNNSGDIHVRKADLQVRVHPTKLTNQLSSAKLNNYFAVSQRHNSQLYLHCVVVPLCTKCKMGNYCQNNVSIICPLLEMAWKADQQTLFTWVYRVKMFVYDKIKFPCFYRCFVFRWNSPVSGWHSLCD